MAQPYFGGPEEEKLLIATLALVEIEVLIYAKPTFGSYFSKATIVFRPDLDSSQSILSPDLPSCCPTSNYDEALSSPMSHRSPSFSLEHYDFDLGLRVVRSMATHDHPSASVMT